MVTAREANRLTDGDRQIIATRLDETIARWRSLGHKMTGAAIDITTLERLAHHSIGCSEADLRDVELAEIATMVRERTS